MRTYSISAEAIKAGAGLAPLPLSLSLLSLLFAAIAPAAADEPVASAPRLIQRLVRSNDARRDWELVYTLTDRRLSLYCKTSMTGRCGVRLVDAPRADAREDELHVEWIGVPVGSTVDRRLQGRAYGLCLRPDVGDDKACEPLSALTPL